MYHPTSRVLTVLELLQSHRRMSGPEIAGRLEVDVRTVRRYITMLQDLGIPVEAEPGRHGGYTLRPGFRLPPLMFNDEEAIALTLGLLVARRLGLASAAPTVEGALAKIERVLPDAIRERVQAVQATLSIELAAPEALIESVNLGTLSLAIQRQRRVAFGYKTGDKISERQFDPYGVAHYGGRWYTAGYCHMRGDMRIFRLDRVQGLASQETTFTLPADFDCLAYVSASFAAIPDEWDCEVLLDTTLENARRVLPASLVLLEQAADGVLLRASIDDLALLARELAHLDCAMTVRTPPELRLALQQLAARLIAA